MNMNDMTKKLYPVTGMHCAACAGNVEKIVRKQEGVENASVNLATATLTVTYNPDIVSPQQLKEAVMKIGFDLIIDEDNSVQEQEEAEQSYYGLLKRKTIVAWIFALPVAVLGMFLMNVPGVNWWMLLLSLPVILYSGRSFYMNAWKQTLQRPVIWIRWWHLAPPSHFCSVCLIRSIPNFGTAADWNLMYIMKLPLL